MSSSRLRNQAPTIFDVFCEIVASGDGDDRKPSIVWKYPDDFDSESTLKSIVEFSFPIPLTDGDDAVQLFTFVLTDEDGRYSFGYCRHTPAKRSCFCVLSALPWTDVFYRLLNHVAGLTKRSPGRLTSEAESLLVRAYHQEIPGSGERLVLDSGLGGGNKVEFVCPDDKLLPRIPDNRNLTEYYNAMREENMLAVFANLLCERRILFTSSKLGKLSACIIGASGLLYPMYWQHIFIPVLPDHLVHYLHAPMPFLIGVPSATFAKIQRERIDLSEVVVMHIDTEEYLSPFDDFIDLPNEVVHVLKKNLRSSNHLLGDGVARSFLRALVVLLGGYREALRFRQGETITFSEEAFVQSRPASLRRFLENMLNLQIFHQFVDDRLSTLNAGEDPRDEFEDECNLYSSKEYSRFKAQYNEWISNMKKEGGTLFKNLSKKMKEKGRDALSRIYEIKESSVSMSSVAGGRTSPAILRRIGSSVNDSFKSPNRRRGNAPRSVLLPGETDALRNTYEEDVKNEQEQQGTSGSFFGVGGIDLLSELEYLMSRPNSFIEKIEQQHQKMSAAAAAAVAPSNKQETQSLVEVPPFDPAQAAPAEDALLIDFGPEKIDATNLDITDFDPLVTKSASAPVSPEKQVLNRNKESATIFDLRTPARPAMPNSSAARHWETFE